MTVEHESLTPDTLSAKTEFRIDETELAGAQERVKNYENLIASADVVEILVGCDDGRVTSVANLQNRDGQKVLSIYVPKIGSGVPANGILGEVLSYVTKLGVAPENIVVNVTQHAGPSELSAIKAGQPVDKLTCGLRAVRAAAEVAVDKLGADINQIAQVLWAKDLSYFSQLEDVADAGYDPEVSKCLADVMQIAKAANLPPRLVFIAAKANFSGDLLTNLLAVKKAISDQVADSVAVEASIYQHNSKVLFEVTDEGKISEQGVSTGVKEWSENHQDPRVLAITFGKTVTAIHRGVYLPETVGQTAANDFSAAAVNKEDLLDALHEGWYAVSHHNHAHKPTDNFVGLEGVVILCENSEKVAEARSVLKSGEMANIKIDYQQLGNVQLVDTEKGKVYQFDWST